jgi:hypothetical protein
MQYHPLIDKFFDAEDKVAFITEHKDEWNTCVTRNTARSIDRKPMCALQNLCEEDDYDDVNLILKNTTCKFELTSGLMQQLAGAYVELYGRYKYTMEPHFLTANRSLAVPYPRNWRNEYQQDYAKTGEMDFGQVLGLGAQDEETATTLSLLFLEGRGDFTSFAREDPFHQTLVRFANSVKEQNAKTQFIHMVLNRHTQEALDSIIPRLCMSVERTQNSYNSFPVNEMVTDVLGQFCTMLMVQTDDYATQIMLKCRIVSFVRYLLKRGCMPFRPTMFRSAYDVVLHAIRTLPTPNTMKQKRVFDELFKLYDGLKRDMVRLRELRVARDAPAFDRCGDEVFMCVATFI